MENLKATSKTILAVDDNPDILKVIKAQLEFAGYAVMCEESGEEALETIKNSSVFAVLLDLGLPGMDGFEVLQNIKRIKPALPVIMVTGDHAEADGRRAIGLGARDYITKPINFAHLKNVLQFLSG